VKKNGGGGVTKERLRFPIALACQARDCVMRTSEDGRKGAAFWKVKGPNYEAVLCIEDGARAEFGEDSLVGRDLRHVKRG
jgi:hypothetical protein